MIHHVRNADSDSPMVIDDTATMATMKEGCPTFFEANHSDIDDETIEVYRGCIIVSNTVCFTGCAPQKKTTVYAWLPKRSDTFCIGWPDDADDAKKTIDRLLKTLEYSYAAFKA